VLTIVPESFVRLVIGLVTHTFFRVRAVGRENVPLRGPALLVADHMAHVDGFLVGASVRRFIRFLVWRPYYERKAFHWFFRLAGAIPTGGGPDGMAETVRAARRRMAEGHAVCIFAEGAISRTASLLPFKRGMEEILEGLDVPVIPVHLDRLRGSIFSFEGGRFSWKWPRPIPYPVTVSFGKPMPATSTAFEVRLAIQELSAEAVALRKTPSDRLDLRMVQTARRNWGRLALADSTGRELTYGRVLAAGIMVSNWVRRACPGEEAIGVMLPASVGGALVNVGATLAGVMPVNLNFTAGREAIASAIAQCGIRTVVTSRQFLAKAKIEAMEGMVFLEDVLAGIGGFEKLRALAAARFVPARMISHNRGTPDSLSTVIFSSGTTGTPKGVMLSHYNVLANIEAMAQLFWIGPRDRIMGILPFFHSFGFTTLIWFPLITACGAAYHPNPTEAKSVGEMVARYRCALLIATPTFLSAYIRKCSREEFASLRLVITGAEKLRASVADAFREKFGPEPVEGYGCTEMAPVVAVNATNIYEGSEVQIANKPGTIGHPLPGVAARIADPVTFEPLPPNAEGLLLAKGANRMVGYLGQPERTAEVVRDGWYVTGDIAAIDDEGFIRITDRLARFSKIAGEMVPHVRIEEAIGEVIGDAPCVVTAIGDDRRGERLVALYTAPEISPSDLWSRLSQTNLPRLWIPKRENLYQVESLPTLGTGKLDLHGVKLRAQELAAVEVTS
jgi:acyl-[acyl-carrier-protein]-phospholipid O-acyltransferase / long-chain-fatty-acid--[acyl-carrier-protein] ligase